MSAPMLSSLVPTANRPRLSVQQTVAAVQETVMVRPRQDREVYRDQEVGNRPAVGTTHLAMTAEQWGWEELRDYVIRQIDAIHGPKPRQASYKEKAIFEGFLTRHGAEASRIAKYAFEVANGYWKNAPISVTRFCANSDPYFSDVIKRHLADVDTGRQIRQ